MPLTKITSSGISDDSITSDKIAAGVVSASDVADGTLTGAKLVTPLDLSSTVITAPRIANDGFIADANGNEQIKFTTTASAVNELTIANAATGGAPSIATTGSDTNIALTIAPKGSGDVNIDADTVRIGDSNTDAVLTTNGTGDLTLSTNSGTNSGTVKIFDGANANIEITPNGAGVVKLDGLSYPTADGSANQALVTNGSGVLSFAAVSADYVRLATATISTGVTSVELTTGISDTYKIYALYIMGVTVATNGAILKLQFGTGGGPTYATSSYKGTDFIITGNVDSPPCSLSGGNNISDCINLNGPNGTANNANYNYNGVVILNNLRSTATLYKHAMVHAAHIQTTDVWQTILGHGYNNGATVTDAAVTGIKILTSSGNMNTGTFVLYGIKTA